MYISINVYQNELETPYDGPSAAVVVTSVRFLTAPPLLKIRKEKRFQIYHHQTNAQWRD